MPSAGPVDNVPARPVLRRLAHHLILIVIAKTAALMLFWWLIAAAVMPPAERGAAVGRLLAPASGSGPGSLSPPTPAARTGSPHDR